MKHELLRSADHQLGEVVQVSQVVPLNVDQTQQGAVHLAQLGPLRDVVFSQVQTTQSGKVALAKGIHTNDPVMP